MIGAFYFISIRKNKNRCVHSVYQRYLGATPKLVHTRNTMYREAECSGSVTEKR